MKEPPRSTEATPLESVALFRTVVEGCPVALALIRDGRFLYANPAALRMFGATSDEDLMGQSILDRVPAEDRPRTEQRIREAREERLLAKSYEDRLLRMDGTEIIAETIGVSVVYEGRPTFLVFANDLTDRKTILAELEASRTLFSALFNQNQVAMALGIWPGDLMEDVNSAWERLTGWSREDTLGRPVHELGLFPEAEEVQGVVRKLSAEGRVENQVLTLQARDGVRRTLLWSGQIAHIEGVDHLLSSAVDISALQETRRALATSEAHYRALVEAMPDYLFVLSRDGRFLSAHSAPDGVLYLPPDTAVGHNLRELFPGALGERALAALEKVCGEGLLQSLNYQLPYPGDTLHFEGRMVPVTPESALLVSRDVTARVKTEASLQANRDLLAQVLDRIQDGFVALDRDWRFTYVNQRAAVMLQRQAPEDLLGKHIWTEYPEGVGQPFHQAYLRAMETQQPVFLEDHYLPWDLWFENRIYPSTEGLSIFFTEITERKRNEAALHKSEADLRASEARLQAITENAPDLILQLDLEGRVRYVNKLLPGYSIPDVIGRDWLLGLNEEFRPIAQSAFQHVLATLQPAEFEARQLFAGELRHFHCRVTPICDGGRPTSLILFATDITEHKRLAEQRTALELQVQRAQKMESLGVLAGGVAHDMNNVLGAILGLATTCRQGQTDGSDLAKTMDTITRACDRGRTLVRSLLDFARKDLAEERVLDLNTLLSDELQILERTTLQRVRLVLDLDPELQPILGDPGALSHAIMNLCINAVDAMPDGGTLTLRSWNAEPELVQLTVEDTGCGMPPEVLERVLDPFFTTKPQGQGTGLGLSIAYGAVKAHRGQLQIQSRPGHGTKVLLSFPACSAKLERGTTDLEVRRPAVHQDLLILVVDDDELVRCSMEILIEELRMRSVITASGEEALSRLEEGLQPDLVILDVNMPGMGGVGFLPLLRGLHPEVPVLLATGRVDQAALDLARTYQGVEIFPKPFAFSELSDRLSTIPARKR